MQNLKIYFHPNIALHDKHSSHELMVAERLPAIWNGLSAGDSFFVDQDISPEDITSFKLAHSAEYIKNLIKMDPAVTEKPFYLTSETVLNKYSLYSAQLGLGAVKKAISEMLANETRSAFCPVYAGHHAGRNKGHGFCFLNTVAYAAKFLSELGLRVAIVDFDTHSGDGTLDIVGNDPNIEFFETYQEGFPAVKYSNVDGNIYRKKVTDVDTWWEAWMEHLVYIKKFQPNYVIVSAGFDAHEDDPLGDIGLTDSDYNWLTSKFQEIQPRILSVLEGGYAVHTVARLCRNHCAILNNKT